ncbi:MAG: Isomerizing Glutamine-fructose-6-phosphate aminotransferase [Candidatus Moranbacteria bacterium GW2011_GWF2_37_7]|nr:MAG: Isomerizing Glutamine-fructose-6-phosphate aminotransferase [Candidatus Moranbacteria bacterium GW2011_GWF2_37_7]
MLKDIKETPAALETLLKNTQITLKKDISKIYIAASGSSRNAANIARYFIEKITNIPVIVDYASEFAHRSVAMTQNDLFIPLSQSGETADVLSALKKAKDKGIATFAITNNENSTIYKSTDAGMLAYAGKETSIPATKSFTCQLMCLYLLGIHLAGKQEQDLYKVPEKIAQFIDNCSELDSIAKQIKDFKSLIILGRGQNWAFAEEGSLKIKETTYINATGYPTGEFLHGHLAVLDENFPVISILTRCFDDADNYFLAIKNTEEIKKKRNPILIELRHGEENEFIAPFITAVMLQLLTYKTAILLGRDTDKPRSLNKVVEKE